MNNTKDCSILRELAKKYAEIAAKDIQDERRAFWRKHNSLERIRPPVLIMGGYDAEIITPMLKCEDEFYRWSERFLRFMILQDTLEDDTVIEPWITVNAVHVLPEDGLWGIPIEIKRADAGIAFQVIPGLTDYDDMYKLVTPKHQIDEKATAENVERIYDAIGGILEININRGSRWLNFDADISTTLGGFRGHEQMMWDMYDHPDELHELLAFMRDGILKAQNEAEIAGDWSITDGHNQAMLYEKTLTDPKPNLSVNRNDMWGFFAAQEFAGVSPEFHDEFLFQYQLPIMEKFGLIAYGCCEDLTKKIDLLKQIHNLRRIAVTPCADVDRCAEQIGSDYVCSYRPNPSLLQGLFDMDLIRKTLTDAMNGFKRYNCIVDTTLKDISTVNGDIGRLKRFASLAKSIAEEY